MSPPHLPGCLDETQLLDLADGVAPESLRLSAEAHVDGCAACRELLAGFLQARAPAASGGGSAATCRTGPPTHRSPAPARRDDRHEGDTDQHEQAGEESAKPVDAGCEELHVTHRDGQ